MRHWILLFLVLLTASGSIRALEAGPRVLLIHSYHPQFAWTAELTRGVRDELSGLVAEEDLYIEYMDARRFMDDAEHERRFLELLRYSYSKFRPDLVMTGDDVALDFVLRHRKELFPGIPVVFSGVNIPNEARLAKERNITGVEEGMAITDNLRLIRRLHPDLERLVLLSDESGLGKKMTRQALQELNQPAMASEMRGVELDVWNHFDYAELISRLHALPEHTVVLLLALHRFSDGSYFAHAEPLPGITAASPAPVYGQFGSILLGKGVVGGLMNDGYEHGHAAAALARRILSGTPADSIAIVPRAEYRPRFDYWALRRFHIDPAKLPDNSEILYQPVNFYERHRRVLNSATGIILSLLAVILLLGRANRRRRQAETALASLNAELEHRVRERTMELAERNAELKRLYATMENLAHTDALTGLPNRRDGSQRLHGLLERRRREGGLLAVVLCDIDHFKRINDTYGHEVGDTVLRALADRLRQLLRPEDLFCRWGGEEFLLLLPDVAPAEARLVCERLRQSIAHSRIEPVGRITISFGLTALASNDTEAELLARADRALYRAKDQGRNRVEFEAPGHLFLLPG